MKYYRLRHAIDAKVIGRKYPQVEKIFIPTTWEDELFIHAYNGKKAPYNVLLPKGILYKSAKLTDLISSSAVGFSLNLLISKQLLSIIEKHRVHGIQFFSTTIQDFKGAESEYYVAHPFSFYLEGLNLNDSEIGYYSDMQYKNLLKPICPNTTNELKEEVNSYYFPNEYTSNRSGHLCIKSVVFSDSLNNDFFSLAPVYGGTGFYISEVLKKSLQDAGCTGLVYTEVNERYP